MFLETPFDELQPGTRWVSQGRTITEAHIVQFAGVSGDWFPLHTDHEYASRTPFGARIAHGMLILSIGIGLIPLPPDILVAFYGLDRVRFTRPVFIGDTVHVELEVARKDARGDHGLLTLLLTVKNHREETVVVSSSKVLVRRQAAVL